MSLFDTETDSRVDESHHSSSRDETFNLVRIEGDVVRLDAFTVNDATLASHLEGLPDDERVDEIFRIISVGVVCCRQVQARNETEFVRREVEKLLSAILPQLSSLPKAVQDKLLAQLGTGDGQALKPVKDNLDQVSEFVRRTVTEVQDFLGEQLDPNKMDAPLGRALAAVSEKLDPTRTGSIQHTVEEALKEVTGGDGALVKTVRESFGELLKPLQEKVDALGEQIRKDEAVAEVVDQTTLKGPGYEARVATELSEIGRPIGAHVDHIGADNKPGDVLFITDDNSAAQSGIRIIVEARDKQDEKGRKQLSDELIRKMTERDANAGIYVCKTRKGLGKTLGDWVEGVNDRGPWIATTHDHLAAAIRMLLVQFRLQALKANDADFDGAAVEAQIQQIRTSLNKVQQIRRRANSAKESMEFISEESLSLKNEVNQALVGIEEALRKASSDDD